MTNKKVTNGEFEEREKTTKEIEVKKEEPVVKVKKKEKVKKSYNNKEMVLAIVLTSLCFIIFFAIFYLLCIKDLTNKEATKLIKDVTITDQGIADAVDKIYDAVVIVYVSKNGREYGSGTGFVYKTDNKYGYIITNNHVVENSTEVKVEFTNGEKYEVEVVGRDEDIDIAVLKVDKGAVSDVANIGSSKDMRIGDTAFAIGTPIDTDIYSWSVTRGILSGKDRVTEVENIVINLLQTDAPINAGNSGGPLCNANGEVVGVVNMKLANSQIEGMGFAIPIEEAVKYADSMVSGESLQKPYLGVSIYDAGSGYFYRGQSGVYIDSVEKGSAADKAGLKSGDKILKVNDTEVSSVSYFRYELFKYNVGDKIKITVERDGKEKVVEATLGSQSVLN